MASAIFTRALLGGHRLVHSSASLYHKTKFSSSFFSVKRNIEDKTYQQIDARSKSRFDGTAPEPRKGIRSGHVPGSKCIPFAQMLDASQTLLPAHELKKRFDQEGISLESPIVTSCGIGVTAAILALKRSFHLQAEVDDVSEKGIEQPESSKEILRNFGCDDSDIAKLFATRPSLRNANLKQLQSKLNLLRGLGISSPDLVKIINCRPRFLSCRINNGFEERMDYFMTLFGSREMLRKAIIRNPSLLTYDLHDRIKSVIALYESMGVSRVDLVPMLLLRPTLISRTTFDDKKKGYIHRTGISKASKMYKYVVTLIGISRVETIQEKIVNLERFGMTDEEIWTLFGRSPVVLTLSVEKVQRNMTFITGTIRQPANLVLKNPFLLYSNLDVTLKPRALLATKIDDMGLSPKIKGPLLLTALRMKETRFLKAFVSCHPEDIARDLMKFYANAKCVKRLAEASKKTVRKGFPF